jgi:mannose-6-phosphate isomerase-like protein (cupin superfamily)
MTAADWYQKRSLDSPDERRTFEKTRIDIVTLDGITFARVTAQPGWKWSECIKPVAKTETCRNRHVGYVVSGRWRFLMEDGSAEEFGSGEALVVPPGHDAWVVGEEPVVYLEYLGADNLARPPD